MFTSTPLPGLLHFSYLWVSILPHEPAKARLWTAVKSSIRWVTEEAELGSCCTVWGTVTEACMGCTHVHCLDGPFIWEQPHSTTWGNILPELLRILKLLRIHQSIDTSLSTPVFQISQCFQGPWIPGDRYFSETDPWVSYAKTKSNQASRGQKIFGRGVTTVDEKNSWFLLCLFIHEHLRWLFLLIYIKSLFPVTWDFSLLSPVMMVSWARKFFVLSFVLFCLRA